MKSFRSSSTKPAAFTLLVLGSFLWAVPPAAFAQEPCCGVPHEHRGYSLASVHGSYAMIGTYAANVARGLGLAEFDGRGGVKHGSSLINQPGPNGTRLVVTVTFDGTYAVNKDGTGTMSLTVYLPNGTTQDVIEDFVITAGEFKDGVPLATAMVDVQEEPSVVILGNVFVTHTYTRRPE